MSRPQTARALARTAWPMATGLLWVALLLGSAQTHAQSAAPNEPRNIIQLSANGSLEAPQDWLSVSLFTSREGNNAALVQDALRQALDSALAELKKAARPGEMEVRSGAFSLQPRYGNDGKQSGWSGSAELLLEGSDFARIGMAASKAQPLTISSLRFSLSRQARAQLESQAQALAIANFKSRASEIAHGFGFADYSLRELNVSASEPSNGPMPRMMAMGAKAMMADAPVAMESGKSLVQVNVSGTVQLK